MKKLLAVLSAGALAALITPTAAHAQSLNDVPEVGPQICTEWQNQLDEFEGQAQDAGTPFAELHAGAQQLHDAACGSGDGGDDPEPPDDGGGDANPLCEPLEQIAAGAEEQPSPGPEFAAGLREIAAAIGCPAPGGDEPPSDDGGEEPGPHCTIFAEIIAGMEENEAPPELIDGFQQLSDGAGCATTTTTSSSTTTTAPAGDDDTGDDDTEVAGEIRAAQTGGGTATPATGGGLLAGGIGLGLVGLASVARRLFGTA